MAILLYGGSRQTIMKQIECTHDWHGPCIDDISRYNKCLKCFCIERDLQTEKAYWDAERESEQRQKERVKEAEARPEARVCMTLRTTKAGEDPEIEIYHVELWHESGIWTETFGSKEQLNAFVKGLKAASGMAGFHLQEKAEKEDEE